MPAEGVSSALNYQAAFHQRWHTLHDPHVRSLAWLLEAPDLLDAGSPLWQGKIASLPASAAIDAAAWLQQLDASPAALHAFLAIQRFTRLGRYAEKLLAWYFQQQGCLFAHGVQVQAGKNETIGEFDFLLRQGDALLHWEFATKFYLLQASTPQQVSLPSTEYFIGPNLADTLGAKMRKILQRQLALGQHPAAQPHLPQPLAAAQALIRGWLFYRRDEPLRSAELGISANHCRGWWCSLQELSEHADELYCAVLPRLAWLAPARLPLSAGMTRAALQAKLAEQFASDAMPVMVVNLTMRDGVLLETERGFVVPDDWRERAEKKLLAGQ
jgi:hypothetical protein